LAQGGLKVEKQEDFAFAEKIYKRYYEKCTADTVLETASPAIPETPQSSLVECRARWNDEDDDAVDRGGRGALERFRKKRSEETIDPEEPTTSSRSMLLLLRHPPVDRPSSIAMR
jgi:hypothetical protein